MPTDDLQPVPGQFRELRFSKRTERTDIGQTASRPGRAATINYLFAIVVYWKQKVAYFTVVKRLLFSGQTG
jgi:hypothetical protein